MKIRDCLSIVAALTLGAIASAQMERDFDPDRAGSIRAKKVDPYFLPSSIRPRPNPRSVRSMERYLREVGKRKAQVEALESFGIHVGDPELFEEQQEWWGSMYWYVRVRAYPKDEIDQSVLTRALAYRKTMSSKRPKLLPDATDYPDSDWAFIGPRNAETWVTGGGVSPITGRISGIAVSHQNPDTVWYVSGCQGGVFKTTNGGTSWTALSDEWDDLYIGDIALDPDNDDIVYAGLGDYDKNAIAGHGMMKTTNAGDSWNLIGTEWDGALVSDILIDPDDSQHLLVAVGRGSPATHDGVWESNNGGNTFFRRITEDTQALSNSIKVGSTRYFWAAGQNSIRRSTDGTNWTSVGKPNTGTTDTEMGIACSKIDQQTVYLLLCISQRIYKSTDNGATWTNLTSAFNGVSNADNWSQSSYDFYIATGRNGSGGDVIFVGLKDLMSSRNGGTTWVDTGGFESGNYYMHVDQHVCIPHPSNVDVMFCGNDGGLFVLTYVGLSFNRYLVDPSPNTNMGITQFYTFDAHPTTTSWFMGGAQDNGTPICKGDTNNWKSAGQYDGTGIAISQTTPGYQYRTYQRAGVPSPQVAGDTIKITRTTDSFSTTNTATVAISANDGAPVFTPPLAASHNALPELYVGSDYLYRLNELAGGSFSWSARLGGFKFDNSITAIAVAPGNASIIYVGTTAGSVYRSGDFGATWTRLITFTFSISCINVDPSAANSILVTLNGSSTGEPNLYRCTNAGAGTPTFSSRIGSGSTQLPYIWTNWVERDPWSPTTNWYVANDLGVFYTDDAGATWYDMTAQFGMPPVVVQHLTAEQGTNRLFAATFGRGAYRMIINGTRPVLTSVNYITNPVVGGFTAQLQVQFDKITPPGGLDITMSHSPNGIVTGQTTAHVSGGRTAQLINIDTNVVANNQTLTTTVTGPFGGLHSDSTLVQSIELANLTLFSSSVVGSYNTTGTVILTSNSPQGGLSVNLSTTDSNVATVPNSVNVPQGQASAQFNISTFSVDVTEQVDIRATFSGETLSRTLTVTPINLSGNTLNQTSITGGDDFTGFVTIASAAGPHGVLVNLSSNNPNAQVPATVLVPNGSTTGSYSGSSSLVSPSTIVATITANKGSSFYTDQISLQPISISSVTFSPNPVIAGRSTTMIVTLSRAIPASGLAVSFQNGSPKFVSVPASQLGFIGSSSISVLVKTKVLAAGIRPTKVRIKATHMSSSKTGTLVVVGR